MPAKVLNSSILNKQNFFLFVLLTISLGIIHPSTAEIVGDKSYLEWLQSNDIAISDGYTISIFSSGFDLIDKINVIQNPDPNNLYNNFILHMDWSPNSQYFAVTIQDYSGQSQSGIILQVWNASTKQIQFALNNLTVTGLAWSPGSQFLAVSRRVPPLYNKVDIINRDTGVTERVIPLDYLNHFIAWHPSGSKVIVDTLDGILTWDISSQLPTSTFLALSFDATAGLQFNSSGDRIAVMLLDTLPDTIDIINLNNQQVELHLSGHTNTIMSFIWKGNRIFTTSTDDTTRIWNSSSGQFETLIPEGWIEDLEVSPNSLQILTQNQEGAVTIRDSSTGAILASLDDRKVNTFSLINSTSDLPVRTFVNSDNLGVSPTTAFNIRADVAGNVAKVVFNLNATMNEDTNFPFVLVPDTNGDYPAWTPAAGSYMLTATPYSADNVAGTPLTLTFIVTDVELYIPLDPRLNRGK